MTACSPRGERAGLVEQHRVDLAHPLEREPVLHEDAGAGGDRGRERDDERDREAERVRARDHEHGHGALDRVVGGAHEHPHDERDDAGGRGDVEEQCGGAVGQRLRTRARRLRLGDEPLDAGERGVVADGLDPHADRGVGRDRAGDDPVADLLRHRPRLAGDHRLVDLRFAVDDRAVGGDTRAGADEHDVAAAQLRRAAPSRPRPSVTTRSASSGSSSASAASAPWAWPIAFISSQWPSSMMTTRSASSHQKSRSRLPTPRLVARLATNATVIASAISSIIPGWRARISATPPLRNGQPP